MATYPTGYSTPKNPTMFRDLNDVLLYFGTTNVDQLSKSLFKATDCGMFAEEPNDRDHADGVDLVIGSTVEGADLVITRKLRFPVLLSEWETACNEIEAWAAAEWHEANCNERMGCGCPQDALHGPRDDIRMDDEVGGDDEQPGAVSFYDISPIGAVE